MSAAACRAEVMKLARLLDVEVESLSYLLDLDADDVRVLRRQATDALYDTNSDLLQRVAAANRLMPTKVLASIAERALGPVMTARLSGLIDPDRAAEVAERLPTDFLAEVAVWIDPRSSSEVIGRIPPSQIAAVAEVLLMREEHVAMGMFVGCLSDDALQETLPLIHDDELLRVGFVLEEKERLDHVVRLLPEDRLPGIVDAVIEHELYDEALDMLAHLGDFRREQLLEIAAEKGITLDGERPAA